MTLLKLTGRHFNKIIHLTILLTDNVSSITVIQQNYFSTENTTENLASRMGI